MTSTFTAATGAPVAADPGRARAAATAAAMHVPAATPLTPGEPVPVGAVDPSTWAGAAVATFQGADTGAIAVLVPAALLEVLANSPMGSLDLAPAIQPALDAAAQAAQATGVSAAESLSPTLALQRFTPAAVAFPLMAPDGVGAVVVVDPLTPPLTASVAPAASYAAGGSAQQAGLEMLHGVMMEVTVELGRTRLPVQELLTLTPGAVLELDRPAGSPVDLLVNGRLIARGEVVVVDENFGLRVTEIVPTAR